MTKHGESQSRLYGIWEGIKSRCFDEHWHIYPYYGGRGITMCDEWRNDFLAFRNWAMSNGYADDLTIERIDVDGDYEPTNCTWIPKSEQPKNRRNLVMVQIGDETKHLAEWARVFNIPLKNVLSRIYWCHWDPISALTIPVGLKGVNYRGKLPPSHVHLESVDPGLNGVE